MGFGVFDEIFNPAGHRAQQDIKEQQDKVAPAPTPADDPKGSGEVDLDGGLVTIDVVADRAIPPERARRPRPEGEGDPDDDADDRPPHLP